MMAEQKTKTERLVPVTFRCPPKWRAELERIARTYHMSRGEVIRSALDLYLRAQDGIV